MGSYFNLTQWQEFELQALIYGHMTAGAAVPEELLHLVRTSVAVADTAVYSLRPHNQPALRYWGRGTVDQEPGRCRRTDGKKWRCSRDVVAGHKYCERHVHRGRNRSRKPVESAAPPYVGEAQRGGSGVFTLTATAASRSADLFHLNQRHCDSIIETKGRFKSQHDGHSTDRILSHSFDDLSKPLHEADFDTNYSTINLSISMPENSASDFSLTLATGTAGEHSGQGRHGLRDNNNNNRPHQLMSWGMDWENSQVAPLGGPLAEALRSASSPTSMQHRLPRGSTS